MPAAKNPKPADSTPADSTPGVDTPGVDETDAEIVDVPMNRAERRAKGRAGSQPQAAGKIQPGRVNPGQSQRQWSSRRSGG